MFRETRARAPDLDRRATRPDGHVVTPTEASGAGRPCADSARARPAWRATPPNLVSRLDPKHFAAQCSLAPRWVGGKPTRSRLSPLHDPHGWKPRPMASESARYDLPSVPEPATAPPKSGELGEIVARGREMCPRPLIATWDPHPTLPGNG